jgi:hypothetical protein
VGCLGLQFFTHSLPVSRNIFVVENDVADSKIRYNSAVLTTSTMNQYVQLVVTEDFLSRPFSNETITGSGPIRPGSYPWGRTYGHAEFSGIIDTITSDYQNQPQNYTSLSVFEGLRRYDTPFKWRPNLIAVADDNSVSLLLPDADCPANSTSCPPTARNKKDASLLDWRVYTPSSLWWKTLCDYTFDGIAGAKCSRLSEWTQEDMDAWTLGHDFKIKRFVINPNPVTEGSLDQQKCHLQCAPVILLGTHRLYFSSSYSRLILASGHYFQRNKVFVHALGHMVFTKRYYLYTRRCYCFLS